MEIVAETWIKNNIYHLKFSDRDILLRVTDWPNDSIMDAAPKLILQITGQLSLLAVIIKLAKKVVQIQPLHDGADHRLLPFNSSGQVHVCDSLRTNISNVTKKCLKKAFVDSSANMNSSRLQWYLFRHREMAIIADYSQLHSRIFYRGCRQASLALI